MEMLIAYNDMLVLELSNLAPDRFSPDLNLLQALISSLVVVGEGE